MQCIYYINLFQQYEEYEHNKSDKLTVLEKFVKVICH